MFGLLLLFNWIKKAMFLHNISYKIRMWFEFCNSEIACDFWRGYSTIDLSLIRPLNIIRWDRRLVFIHY